MRYRIVLTGAPGSGKTECLNRLKTVPELDGFQFFDELARQLLEEQPDYRERWHEFHREIYFRQINRENSIGNQSFITDRGTVDAFAFHPETAASVGTSITDEYLRYDNVFHLDSSANLGEQYYNQDNIRSESIEDTLYIEKTIYKVWSAHPGYIRIPVVKSFEEKYTEFLKTLLGITNK